MAYNNYGGYDGGGGDGYDNNYTTTSYGAQGGQDGGGFLAGSQGGEKKNPRNNDTLRPITIRQVHLAEEIHSGGEITLDGSEVTRVGLVAEVRTITKQTTSTVFKLDDGTGTIEGRFWSDAERPTHDDAGQPISKDDDTVAMGDWARILGEIKFIQNKRFIAIRNIKKVTDKNEINYHLLDATFVHLYLTRGPADSLQNNGSAGPMQGLQSSHDQTSNAANDGLRNFSAVAKRVYQRLLQDESAEGLHVDMISRELNLEYAQVTKAVQELSDESKVFTTQDDFTYAAYRE